MEKLYAFLISLTMFYLNPVIAQTESPLTLKEQLVSLNICWKDKNLDDPVLKERIYLNDEVSLIQMHLSLVEKILRTRSTENLTVEQKYNRVKSLDILHNYWVKGVFPQNFYHGQRTPYFIDDFGTNCAVGEMVVQTGYGDFAEQIRKENNYSYIRGLSAKYPLLLQWANTYGFEMDELAWIQPGYISCDSLCDEVATAWPLSGTPPYTYLWSNGEATATALTLCPGNVYSITIIDSLGDTITDAQIAYQASIYIGTTFMISPPYPPIYLSLSSTPDTSSCNGTATANASGSSPSYQFQWMGGQTDSMLSNLCYGTYYVTVTDVHMCSTTDSVMVYLDTGSTSCSLTLAQQNDYCGMCNGSVSSNPTGQAPFSFLWSTGDTTQNIVGLCQGIYSLTVTDSNGCLDSAFAFISSDSYMALATGTNATCNGCCDGTATATPTGGFSPYSYSWSCTSQTTPSVTGLCAGTCTVTVTDSAGCLNALFLTITEPPPSPQNIGSLNIIPSNPTITDTVKVICHTYFPSSTCLLGSSSVDIVDTNIAVYASHNVGSATMPCQSIDTLIIGQLNAGTYELTYHLADTAPPITYDSDTIIFTVQQQSGLQLTDYSDLIIHLYPNPNTGEFIIELSIVNKLKGPLIRITNGIGQVVYMEKLGYSIGTIQKAIDISAHSAGMYILQVLSDNAIVLSKKVILDK